MMASVTFLICWDDLDLHGMQGRDNWHPHILQQPEKVFATIAPQNSVLVLDQHDFAVANVGEVGRQTIIRWLMLPDIKAYGDGVAQMDVETTLPRLTRQRIRLLRATLARIVLFE